MRSLSTRDRRIVMLMMWGLLLTFVPRLVAQEASDDAENNKAASNEQTEVRQPAPKPPLQPVPLTLNDDFGEDWSQEIRVSSAESLCDTYRFWVQDGWFYVRRTDSHDDLDWQIKLADVESMGRPAIAVSEPDQVAMAGGEIWILRIASEDGRYFIRDAGSLLRAVRQRSADESSVPREELLGEEFESAGWGRIPSQGLTISGWHDGSWYYTAAGPSQERINSIVRLNQWSERNSGGYGFSSYAADFALVRFGDASIWDDGELLFATRTLRTAYERALVRKKIQENLSGSAPPAIDASGWLNSDVLTWKDLEGKVVLLDFWATWCGPCIEKLPAVQALADRYGEQGLVVIGVHSQTGADKCPAFVSEQKLTFPIAIDAGETVDRFGIEGVPSYFLIDRLGKVAQGYATQLPADATIRRLLDADVAK